MEIIKKKLTKFSFLKTKINDFVIADSIIKSPWIEYVLQQFAYSFIRIGVDNANEYEAKEFGEKKKEIFGKINMLKKRFGFS